MKNLSTPLFFFIIIGIISANFALAVNPSDVVINEICWMGTEKSSSDEWIELYNQTELDIALKGWGLYENNGQTLIEPLTNKIPAKSFYLIERTDETTVPNISVSQEPSGWSGYGLKNDGEHVQLLDNKGNIIDEVNCADAWFAGDNQTKQTMERKNNHWQTSQKPNGTPKAENSPGQITKKIVEDGPLPIKESVEVKPQQSQPLPAALILGAFSGAIILLLKKKLVE